MTTTLDLSNRGMTDWLLQCGREVHNRLGRLAMAETWPMSGTDEDVVAELAEFGRLLSQASPDTLAALASDDEFLDAFRVILAYTSADRRLRVMTWLCDEAGETGAELLHTALAYVDAGEAAETEVAAAVRVVNAFLNHIIRTRTIERLFAPERLDIVLRATDE